MKSNPNIETTRNTQSNLDYYSSMEELMEASNLSYNQLIQDFPVFASRQQITYLLERYEIYKLVQNVPGSILEFGVAGGFGLMSFAHFCSIFEPTHYVRRIYGFDTFEGFPSIHEKDRSSGAAHMKVGGLKHDSYDYLQKVTALYDKNRFLSHIPKLELIKGDVTETLPKFLRENPHLVVAMLYLDVDLYEPTKVALNLLRSRIPKGGIIVFDELNHKDYPGETVAVQEVIGLSNLRLERIPFASMTAYAVVD
jgi:hypothetical protein